MQLRNDADRKLQKISGRCLILLVTITSLALELPKSPSNIVRGKNLVTVSRYKSAASMFCLKHKYLRLLISYLSCYFGRGVNFAGFFLSQTVRVGSNFAKIEKS